MECNMHSSKVMLQNFQRCDKMATYIVYEIYQVT